jgi:hypothetical protein
MTLDDEPLDQPRERRGQLGARGAATGRRLKVRELAERAAVEVLGAMEASEGIADHATQGRAAPRSDEAFGRSVTSRCQRLRPKRLVSTSRVKGAAVGSRRRSKPKTP